jgi:alpha-N-arabinofuranosidase
MKKIKGKYLRMPGPSSSKRTHRYQGAILRGHHVLLIKHREHATGHSYWVMPGGGREPGETEEACVRREMLEETHLKVRVGSLLQETWGGPPGDDRCFKTYLCRVIAGEAQPGAEPEEERARLYEISEVRWFDLRDPGAWETELRDNPYTYPLMHRIRSALGYTAESPAKGKRKFRPRFTRSRRQEVPVTDTQSTIQVNAKVLLDSIDPRLYGQNIEHMGRQVLGGLVAEPGSRAPQDDRGFRLDVREAIQDLKPPLLRWPCGCFADSYHWSDGVGPDRRTVPNRMWGRFLIRMVFGNPPFPLGPQEDNRFGTDEFIELCRLVGAEPSLTASLGGDDPGEASGWVAYIRDRYGPGAVPTWSVGNEQWNIIEPNGCVGKPGRYVERFHRFAQAMRRADPGIRLVASGGDALTLPKWNEKVIRGIGGEMDFLSMHLYMPAWVPLRSHVGNSPGDYYAIAASGLALEEQIQIVEELADRLIGRSLPIAYDEWNILGPLRRFTDPYQTQREAVGVAGILHAFHRQAKYVSTAAMFAMLNSAAPPLLTTRDALLRTPIFHVLHLYRQFTGRTRVLTGTKCPTVDIPKLLNLPARRSVPLLDVSATLDDRRLTVFVINRHHREEQAVELEISGFSFSDSVQIHTVAASGYQVGNTTAQPDAVTEQITQAGWTGRHVFPPCSVTALVLQRSS